MDELKINQISGMIIILLKQSNGVFTLEEIIAALHATITTYEQKRIQQHILNTLAKVFMPTNRETIN